MKKILFIAGLLLMLWGCTKEKTDATPDEPFILLVYLAADNSLSGEATQKLEAIRQGYNPKSNARVIVYTDEQDTRPRLLEITANGKETVIEVLIEYPEQNSASTEVFAGVIDQIAGLSEAQRYGLLFFSHASGWLPQGALNNPMAATGSAMVMHQPVSAQPSVLTLAHLTVGSKTSDPTRSVGQDGTDEMELADFAAAIPDGFFEYIVFEACFMTGIETLYPLKDKAQFILASSAEILSPGFTNIYPESFPLLLKGSGGLVPFAQAAFDHYNNQNGWRRSATFSVIRTASLSPLMDFIRTEVPLETGNEMEVSTLQAFDRYGSHLFFDLADCYTSALSGRPATATQLNRLIGNCIVWKAATPAFLPGYAGFTIDTHCGLTTYWPQSAFPGLNSIWLDMMNR